MRTVSALLDDKIKDDSQTVVPKVIATFGSNRTLENYILSSTSEFFESQIARKSPVGYWRLNDFDIDPSATEARDSAQNDLNGAITGTANDTSGPLLRNHWIAEALTPDSYAMTFGSGDRIVVTDTLNQLDITDEITLSAWVNPSSTASSHAVMCKALTSAAADYQYSLYIVAGEFVGTLSDGTSFYSVTGGTATTSTWHYVVVTKSATQIKLYINGTLVDATLMEVDINTSAGSFAIGQRGSQSNDYFLGSIAEVAVFDRELSISEIECLYGAGINDGDYIGADTFNGPDNLMNIIPEETFAYATTDALDIDGDTIVANGEFIVYDDEPVLTNEYGWCSRSITDSSGLATNDEIVIIEFDERKCNGLMFSTGYELGQVKTLKYKTKTEDTWSSETTVAFDMNDSVVEVEFAADLDINAVYVECTESWNPLDLMRLYEVDILYKKDISEDVIDFTVNKTSENYDGSLPIGQSAANTFDITLNNTELSYNKYGDHDYSPFIEPDVKLEVYLGWVYHDPANPFADTIEYIKQGDFYVDVWNPDSSSMKITAQCRDWSKYLMEDSEEEGFINYNTAAGRAIANIMKSSGFPARKIQIRKTFFDTVFASNPLTFWRLSELEGTTISDLYGFHDGVLGGSGHVFGWPSLINGEANAATYYLPERGVPSWRNGTSVENPNSKVVYSTQFNGFAGNRITVADHTDFTFTTEMSASIFFRPEAFPTGTDMHHIFLKGDDDINPVSFSIYMDSSHKIRAKFREISGGNLQEVVNDTVLALDTNYFICVTFNNGVIKLTVNDNTKTVTAAFTELYDTTQSISIGGSPNTSPYPEEIRGRVCSAILWDRALSSQEVSDLWIAADLDTIYDFPYIYMQDQTVWDCMLEIAVADIGRFYFDEDEYFMYEYRNTLHEGSLPRHTESQYTFSDDENIISGSHNVEVQVNKIVVKVNPITTMNSGYQQIWRAESGESLVVTELAENISEDSTEFLLLDCQDPIWLSSGYLKIDDEIMSYSTRFGNTISGVERGLYGTTREKHLVGALARETRVYNIEYDQSPSVSVKRPFITEKDFDRLVGIDVWKATAFKAELVISGNELTEDGDLLILEGTDPVTELNNYFSIAGIPLVETSSNEQVVEEYEELSGNIRKFRIKLMTIDNKFIQNKVYAKKIAQFVVSHFALPDPIINLDIHCVPHLQIHDLVTVSEFAQLEITDEMYWVTESSITYDGGLKHNIVMRKYTEPIDL